MQSTSHSAKETTADFSQRTPRIAALLTGLFFLIPSFVISAEKLVFNIKTDGFPPYTMISDDKPQGSGIVIDLLNLILPKLSLELKLVSFPRKRIELSMLAGEIDATSRAKEWSEKPEHFVFTDSILKTEDVILFLKKKPLKFSGPNSLKGKKICAHLGYVYPALDPLLEKDQVHRLDIRGESEILGMLRKGRCDAAVMNLPVALWIDKTDPWQDEIAYSKRALQSYEYRFMFTRKWEHLVPKFNQEISALRKSGELNRIINKYRRSP